MVISPISEVINGTPSADTSVNVVVTTPITQPVTPVIKIENPIIKPIQTPSETIKIYTSTELWAMHKDEQCELIHKLNATALIPNLEKERVLLIIQLQKTKGVKK